MTYGTLTYRALPGAPFQAAAQEALTVLRKLRQGIGFAYEAEHEILLLPGSTLADLERVRTARQRDAALAAEEGRRLRQALCLSETGERLPGPVLPDAAARGPTR